MNKNRKLCICVNLDLLNPDAKEHSSLLKKSIRGWIENSYLIRHTVEAMQMGIDFHFDPTSGRLRKTIGREWRKRVDNLIGLFAGRTLLLGFLATIKLQVNELFARLDLVRYVEMLKQFDKAIHFALGKFYEEQSKRKTKGFVRAFNFDVLRSRSNGNQIVQSDPTARVSGSEYSMFKIGTYK